MQIGTTSSFRSAAFATVVALGLIGGACSGTTGPSGDEDRAPAAQKDDSFLEDVDGKGDSAYDIEPGSPKAQALLTFVNSASKTKLDDDVSLDVRAATNIVRERSDEPIASLEELDAIDWVGSRAFRKLYRYCDENGIFDDSNSSSTDLEVEPGSAEAKAILELANLSAAVTLDEEVSLDGRTARNIVDYRDGPDGRAGTRDDRAIATLSELDSIERVEQWAITKMLEYTRADGNEAPVLADSARALGAFRVANDASQKRLDDTVALDSRAAKGIVEYRRTSDYASIKELKRTKWVGPVAIRKLADYAEAQEKLPAVHHGIPVGSRRAHGIVKVANEASESTLDDSLGLDSRAATNMIDYRQGVDGQFDTSDDREFETVADLAGVSYVADRAFEKLLREARNRGDVPPQFWRDALPSGRIETTLRREASDCEDTKFHPSGNEVSIEDGGDGHVPRYLEDNGRYRMYGENPGDLYLRFKSGVNDGAIPDQVPILVDAGGRFHGGQAAGHQGYTWEDLDHKGHVDRKGGIYVLLISNLEDWRFTMSYTVCKLRLSIP